MFIEGYAEGAVKYSCCSCRSKAGNSKGIGKSQLHSAFDQLLRMVEVLFKRFSELTNKINDRDDHVRETRENRNVHTLRTEMQLKLRELREQDRRSNSTILKGFTEENVTEKFSELCNFLGVGSIPLSDLTEIRGMEICRAKINDKKKRKELLNKVKLLRFRQEYKRFYVQRDLTYNQRQELKRRVVAQGGSVVIAGDGFVGGQGANVGTLRTSSVLAGRGDAGLRQP